MKGHLNNKDRETLKGQKDSDILKEGHKDRDSLKEIHLNNKDRDTLKGHFSIKDGEETPLIKDRDTFKGHLNNKDSDLYTFIVFMFVTGTEILAQ